MYAKDNAVSSGRSNFYDRAKKLLVISALTGLAALASDQNVSAQSVLTLNKGDPNTVTFIDKKSTAEVTIYDLSLTPWKGNTPFGETIIDIKQKGYDFEGFSRESRHLVRPGDKVIGGTIKGNKVECYMKLPNGMIAPPGEFNIGPNGDSFPCSILPSGSTTFERVKQ